MQSPLPVKAPAHNDFSVFLLLTDLTLQDKKPPAGAGGFFSDKQA